MQGKYNKNNNFSVCSEEMCEALGHYIEKLVSNEDRFIRKKAILCIVRMIRKCPDRCNKYFKYINSITKETSQSKFLKYKNIKF